jgi:hypothetical protein
MHALESLERVRQAHRDAAARHLDAGAAHRRAAALHEQAALVARDRASDDYQDAAARHRAAAAFHDDAARVEDEKSTFSPEYPSIAMPLTPQRPESESRCRSLEPESAGRVD